MSSTASAAPYPLVTMGVDLVALSRALEQGLRARRLGYQTYGVTSHSQPGHWYRVTIRPGWSHCECPASRACKHLALALVLHLSDAVPVPGAPSPHYPGGLPATRRLPPIVIETDAELSPHPGDWAPLGPPRRPFDHYDSPDDEPESVF